MELTTGCEASDGFALAQELQSVLAQMLLFKSLVAFKRKLLFFL
jgi:hypothetical protein